MRDQENGATARLGEYVAHERLGGVGVEMRGRLVEHEDGRVGEEGARDDEALTLAPRQLSPLLPDERVETGGERADPLVEARAAERGDELARPSRPGARA